MPAERDTGIRFSVADARAAHQRLSALGVGADNLLHPPYAPPMFTFVDANRNRFYVVQETTQRED